MSKDHKIGLRINSNRKLKIACRAVLRGLSCRTIHQDLYLPVGSTCFDAQRHAIENPAGYKPDFRAAIIHGEHLCEHCAAAAALDALIKHGKYAVLASLTGALKSKRGIIVREEPKRRTKAAK